MPLTIFIPETEFYDEVKQEFLNVKATTLLLEHSLVSLSKWEAKYCKPFLTKEKKSDEEALEYIRCMTITQNVDPLTYQALNDNYSIMSEIMAYIEAPMTATTISKDDNRPPNREIITSEVIYYWMVTYNIPVEFQKWHLNRLLTLIQVCNAKNQQPKKMRKEDIHSRNRALNAARRQKLNSKG